MTPSSAKLLHDAAVFDSGEGGSPRHQSKPDLEGQLTVLEKGTGKVSGLDDPLWDESTLLKTISGWRVKTGETFWQCLLSIHVEGPDPE
ncbi:unnamed protein product [Orchesella dallaii]|uniref:Uncharacterized protein n=1 Tax=Orchesella dallaii TaxID=48710 RepID=A0ABP1RRN3_9HEXA